ncbi:hypothetical protein BABINDRAFT_160237 [Babjeviella inositovora NRRL Y-12698]|uniref:SCP domain-containing protein n=1 Tax=Babjeviella inositovora NRRL Y-12698 TaxID=984486 RepID=A0A1E3QWH7_9ASCO|nr:uncharacterized protein BABINDRAFT_160237 [Babjeviella inositovora NRRL Y-12698]ODQ82028.1 hypothetical protein BABINDRAFT_160237 [Babjeviella inositovora NRRL Y-12698]
MTLPVAPGLYIDKTFPRNCLGFNHPRFAIMKSLFYSFALALYLSNNVVSEYVVKAGHGSQTLLTIAGDNHRYTEVFTYVQVLALGSLGQASKPPSSTSESIDGAVTGTGTETVTGSISITAVASTPIAVYHDTILKTHNQYRGVHQVESLLWSQALATYAQSKADRYDCSGKLAHSGGPYGENLAYGYSVKGAINAWYNEGSDYAYYNETASSDGITDEDIFKKYGHFTQLLWKGSGELGCGIKTCINLGVYLICSYGPQGNVVGHLQENVFPKLVQFSPSV